MSDESQDQVDDQEPQTSGVKALREKAEADARELSAARRENAFLRAGVDLDSKMGQIFAKGYDGDLDPEAIRTEWSDLAPRQESAPPPVSLEAQERDAFMRNGSIAPAMHDEAATDPIKAGWAAFDERMKEGASRREASAEIISRLIDAGARGDHRVVYDRDRWLEQQGFTG